MPKTGSHRPLSLGFSPPRIARPFASRGAGRGGAAEGRRDHRRGRPRRLGPTTTPVLAGSGDDTRTIRERSAKRVHVRYEGAHTINLYRNLDSH